MQCLRRCYDAPSFRDAIPQLINAGKYAISLVSITMAVIGCEHGCSHFYTDKVSLGACLAWPWSQSRVHCHVAPCCLPHVVHIRPRRTCMVVLQGQWTLGRCVWFTALVCGTIYSYIWDITMDWSLFQKVLVPKRSIPAWSLSHLCAAFFNAS